MLNKLNMEEEQGQHEHHDHPKGNSDYNVFETNKVVRVLWNILFSCFYPFILVFTIVVSTVVMIVSFIANTIFRLFRK